MARVRDGVIVLTGASSGIGRATAHLLAKRGAKVVLMARNEPALHDVEHEVKQLGGQALVIPCDVTDEAAVKAAAERTVQTFGRIDAWVNCAAVTSFGEFEQVPSEAFRRVVETDLFGTVHGARAALPAFRAQGGGVLVNVGSVVGKVAQPYATAYVSSKYAIRGFTEALRKELYGTGIHVCSVLPESTDTPLFQHGANYSRRAVRPMPPIDTAEKVAERIVSVIERPKREVSIGASAWLGPLLHFVGRGLGERLFARQVERTHFEDRAAGVSTGNLFRPSPDDAVSGGWIEHDRKGKALRRVATVGLVIAPVAVLRWYLSAQPRRHSVFAGR